MIEAPDGGAGGGWLVHTVAFYLGQWRQVQITGTRSGGHHRSITMSCPLPATRLFILPYHTIPPGLLVIWVLLVVAFVFVDVG
jgi:hypothetical protein